MVELSDPKSHEKFAVDVKLLLIPGVLLFLLVGKLKQFSLHNRSGNKLPYRSPIQKVHISLKLMFIFHNIK